MDSTDSEVGVNRTCKTIMSVAVLADTARAEVLGRKHTACSHNPDERIEIGIGRIDTFIEGLGESTVRRYVQLDSFPLNE